MASALRSAARTAGPASCRIHRRRATVLAALATITIAAMAAPGAVQAEPADATAARLTALQIGHVAPSDDRRQLRSLRLSALPGLDDASPTVAGGTVEPVTESNTPRPDPPPFGFVLHGPGAFLSDFEIDCDGRTFRRVSPGGGQRNAPRPNGRRHRGIDIRVRDAEFVCYGRDRAARVVYLGFAGETATVVALSCGAAAGRCVVLEREQDGSQVTTVFAHLKSVAVELGQEISPGQVIGVVGKSGRATGPHLHYEHHVDGRSIRLARIDRKQF